MVGRTGFYRARHWAATALLLVALALGTFLYLFPTIEVNLSKETIQQAIQKKLPLEGRKLGVRYEVRSAEIDLRFDGRIALDADITASVLGRTVFVKATGSGVPIYRDGAFYVSEFSLEKAEIRKAEVGPNRRHLVGRTPERFSTGDGDAPFATSGALVENAKEVASGLIRAVLDQQPVYHLKTTDARQSLLNLSLRDMRVNNGVLVVTLDPLSAAYRILIAAGIVVLITVGFLIFFHLWTFLSAV